MSKKPRSFSIDEDIDKLLSNKKELNASAAVNTFLREYVNSGKGEEAALEIRLQQIDTEISDLESKLTKKRRERDRIETQLEARQSELNKMLDFVETKIEKEEFPQAGIKPDNPAIQNWASEAGVTTQRFITKLESRL
jgi:predicted nuclease with TOPRIM domain